MLSGLTTLGLYGITAAGKQVFYYSPQGVEYGGEGGIRTHGTVASTPDFESGTFVHSVTSPKVVEIKGVKG